LSRVFHRLSRDGLRVVGIAYRSGAQTTGIEEVPSDLVFAGFLAMQDSLRPEVPDALARAQAANVRVVMMTGDHKVTATAIAKQAGIWVPGSEVLADEDLQKLSPAQLDAIIPRVSVFARITPEHKMQLIESYRRSGAVVAMTGDGVNDAPSLVAADLGVAMGKIGTEVAKEAADIVLLDDNFGTIVAAIEEGRNMYATIQKAILYLFSTSLGELLSITAAMLAGLPVPILPAQILWLNLVTDPFMGSALALDPKEDGLLDGSGRGVKGRGRSLVTGEMLTRIVVMGGVMMVGTLAVFQTYLGTEPAKAYTMSLTVLAIFQWFNAWNCRSSKTSVFAANPFRNPYLVLGTLLVVALQVLVVYMPVFQGVLHTVPLTAHDWGFAVLVSTLIVFAEEARKAVMRVARRA
jgi:Ca2+-transporting ATPase